MRIKRYLKFGINESKNNNEDNINDIFAEFIDDGFSIELQSVFYNPSTLNSDKHSSNRYTNPGLVIFLSKKSANISIINMSNIVLDLQEAIDRLSDLGDAHLRQFNLYEDNLSITIKLMYEEKIEVSNIPGFYDFFEVLRSYFIHSNNKVTNSFELQQGKDFVILNPKEGVNSRFLLSDVKRNLKKRFDPWYQTWNTRTSHEYTYDVELVDGKIKLNYKGQFRLNNRGERVDN